MKKQKGIVTVLLLLLLLSITNVTKATENITKITLGNETILVNDNVIGKNASESVYLTSSMNNGGSSEEAKKANKAIDKIINITRSGTYEISGNLSNGQIAIGSNDIEGEVVIILNNANITCENAPAIFVYNKETNSSKCKVTIRLAEGSNNTITGGKLKQSVEGWSDQSEVLYHIEKGYDDDRQYYERYKYDGAISSDISLTLEGEGTLTVNGTEKEGIESKRDITINSGDYKINSLDDGINACTDNESVITINGGTILVNVRQEAEEGDGIDSNGSIIINGGTVYAFASEKSQDNGLDADKGIYINGGTVVGTGNMADSISQDSKQSFIQAQFREKVAKETLITITDNNNQPIVAFQSDRSYSVLTISTPNLPKENNLIYEGGTIEGNSQNRLYTQITSYTLGTEKQYNSTGDRGERKDFERNDNTMESNNKIYYYVLTSLGVVFVFLIVITIMLRRKGVSQAKEKVMILITGMVIGAIIAMAGSYVYNEMRRVQNDTVMEDNMPQMRENGDMPPQKPFDENG